MTFLVDEFLGSDRGKRIRKGLIVLIVKRSQAFQENVLRLTTVLLCRDLKFQVLRFVWPTLSLWNVRQILSIAILLSVRLKYKTFFQYIMIQFIYKFTNLRYQQLSMKTCTLYLQAVLVCECALSDFHSSISSRTLMFSNSPISILSNIPLSIGKRKSLFVVKGQVFRVKLWHFLLEEKEERILGEKERDWVRYEGMEFLFIFFINYAICFSSSLSLPLPILAKCECEGKKKREM